MSVGAKWKQWLLNSEQRNCTIYFLCLVLPPFDKLSNLTTADPTTIQVIVITAHARAESNISMRKKDGQYMTVDVPRNRALFSHLWWPRAARAKGSG